MFRGSHVFSQGPLSKWPNKGWSNCPIFVTSSLTKYNRRFLFRLLVFSSKKFAKNGTLLGSFADRNYQHLGPLWPLTWTTCVIIIIFVVFNSKKGPSVNSIVLSYNKQWLFFSVPKTIFPAYVLTLALHQDSTNRF